MLNLLKYLQLEDKEKERVAFETMKRPDFDGTGGMKIQGDIQETWTDKLYKGWQQEPLLPLVPLGMKMTRPKSDVNQSKTS